MSFHDVVFPEHLSYGTRGGASFSTAIMRSDSGVERRSAEWELDRHRMQFDVAKAVQNEDDLAELMDFYICMRGAACGFRFKDVADFSTARDGVSYPTQLDDSHPVVALSTSTPSFQMMKGYANEYGAGASSFMRRITRPIPPGDADHRVLIYWNGQLVWRSVGSGPESIAQGVTAAIDYSQGVIVFNQTAPEDIRVACTFHVPSRFGEEVDAGLDITWEAPGQFSIATLPIVEITGDPPSGEEEWMEGGFEVLPTRGDQSYGYQYPGWQRFHDEVEATQPFALYTLPQFITTATQGVVPQTPLVSGEYYTGGPMHIISNASTSTSNLIVRERSSSGTTFGTVGNLGTNQYVEVYWMGNTIGFKAR